MTIPCASHFYRTLRVYLYVGHHARHFLRITLFNAQDDLAYRSTWAPRKIRNKVLQGLGSQPKQALLKKCSVKDSEPCSVWLRGHTFSLPPSYAKFLQHTYILLLTSVMLDCFRLKQSWIFNHKVNYSIRKPEISLLLGCLGRNVSDTAKEIKSSKLLR